jgi:hypothetical protein
VNLATVAAGEKDGHVLRDSVRSGTSDRARQSPFDHELARRVPVVDLAIIGVERGKVAGDFGSEDQVPPS